MPFLTEYTAKDFYLQLIDISIMSGLFTWI